jgi:hypothetical protein
MFHLTLTNGGETFRVDPTPNAIGDTLKALYEEACAARSAATDEQTWDFLDRRCSKLAREIDDFVRGRANAIQAGDREAV